MQDVGSALGPLRRVEGEASGAEGAGASLGVAGASSERTIKELAGLRIVSVNVTEKDLEFNPIWSNFPSAIGNLQTTYFQEHSADWQ